MSKHERTYTRIEKMAVGTRPSLRLLVPIIRDLEKRIEVIESSIADGQAAEKKTSPSKIDHSKK